MRKLLNKIITYAIAGTIAIIVLIGPAFIATLTINILGF